MSAPSMVRAETPMSDIVSCGICGASLSGPPEWPPREPLKFLDSEYHAVCVTKALRTLRDTIVNIQGLLSAAIKDREATR